MGMIFDGKRMVIFFDILGDEDVLGDMDFKVMGIENGIMACQMDIKIDGLFYEELEKVLNQVCEGWFYIFNEMKKVFEVLCEDFKLYVLCIVEIIIDKSFIGVVIGLGGKVIQEIQVEIGININIEEVGDEGVVSIVSENKELIDVVFVCICCIIFILFVGDIYDVVVKIVMFYGVFVDFMGKSGLLYVLEIDYVCVDCVEDFFQEGDEVCVKFIGVDKKIGKLCLFCKVLLLRLEGGGGDCDNGCGCDDNCGGGNCCNCD